MDQVRPAEPPSITAILEDGPLQGLEVKTHPVEGRPPKTLDIDAPGATFRYALSDWVQTGLSAKYSFLYRI